MEKYEVVKDLAYGTFGVTRLLMHKETKELVAMKYIERGTKIDANVTREIINHSSLSHSNIIGFKKVILTPTHLVIVMEYAAGGELFHRLCAADRFSEHEARFFFQQLICGVEFCHSKQICHRDLKLENILLDGNTTPRVKICDFGYSKSSLLHSIAKSRVGTPAYMAPEILAHKTYDGKIADVWSCGVILYMMLVGKYPFEDPHDPYNYKMTVSKILAIHYKIPEHLHISQECRDLLSRIFVANCVKRITIKEIRSHPWFLKYLPRELSEGAQIYNRKENEGSCLQRVEEMIKIIDEARNPTPTSSSIDCSGGGSDEEQW